MYQDMLLPRIFKKRYLEAEVKEDLSIMIATHPNGIIVIQLNEPMQSIFMSDIEATAIAKALLTEARRVRIRRLQ